MPGVELAFAVPGESYLPVLDALHDRPGVRLVVARQEGGAAMMAQRTVVCLAGDGCLQMTLQELGTAMQERLAISILVVNNGSYGTIRMHQE